MQNKVYTKENWSEMLEAMDSGKKIAIDDEAYFYFLEVLPPVFMNKPFYFKDGEMVQASFGFAEGSEPVTVFWEEKGMTYCRKSEVLNPC